MSRLPAPLRRGDFRALWLAGLISDAGDWMLRIALPLVVYQLTGSALGTAAAFLAELAPGILLAPLAGRLADRVDRRRIMLAVSVLQAVALLPLLLVAGRAGLVIVYAVIVVQAGLATLFDPAKNALLPALVPSQELLPANSLIALNGGLARLVGGPLGGLLLAAGHVHLIVLADAISFAAAAALLLSLAPARPAKPTGPPPGQRRWASLRLRRGFPRIVRVALGVTFIDQIGQGIFVVLFILFVSRRLHGTATDVGLLRGLQALGAIAAGLVVSLARPSRTPIRLITISALSFGLISLTVWNGPAVTISLAPYILLFILVGAPGVLGEMALVTVLQQAVGEGGRGRVFGAVTLAANAGQAVGMVAAGTLTALVGLEPMLDGQGLLFIASALLATRMALPGPASSGRLRRWRVRSTHPSSAGWNAQP